MSTIAPVKPALAKPVLIDANAVALILDCSARHVARMAAAGAMPRPRRLGALVRWSRMEVENWIAAGCPANQAREGN